MRPFCLLCLRAQTEAHKARLTRPCLCLCRSEYSFCREVINHSKPLILARQPTSRWQLPSWSAAASGKRSRRGRRSRTPPRSPRSRLGTQSREEPGCLSLTARAHARSCTLAAFFVKYRSVARHAAEIQGRNQRHQAIKAIIPLELFCCLQLHQSHEDLRSTTAPWHHGAKTRRSRALRDNQGTMSK